MLLLHIYSSIYKLCGKQTNISSSLQMFIGCNTSSLSDSFINLPTIPTVQDLNIQESDILFLTTVIILHSLFSLCFSVILSLVIW